MSQKLFTLTRVKKHLKALEIKDEGLKILPLFHQYFSNRDNGRVVMKGCVQWNKDSGS